MTAGVFEYPFDLVKIPLQSQVLDNTARFGGPLDCLVQTWRGEGIRTLSRKSLGRRCPTYHLLSILVPLPVPTFGAMAEPAALFVAYGQLRNGPFPAPPLVRSPFPNSVLQPLALAYLLAYRVRSSFIRIPQ